MLEELITIYVWPDETWCEPEDLEDMLTWMSGDFEVRHLTQEEYDTLI